MKKLLVIAAVLASPALVSGAKAAGADETPAAAAEPAAKKDPVICRVDRATGSRVRVNRVCMTKSKWDEMQKNIRSGINQMTQNSRGTNGGNPLGGN